MASILLILSVSVCAQSLPLPNDTLITISSNSKNIYKLITHGKEKVIRDYFKSVTFDELVRADSGDIARAITWLRAKEKVTHAIWILEEVKNCSIDKRGYVYTELEKAEYGRLPFFLKTMVNNYFTNFNEKEVTLQRRVSALQRKMN